jgi:hypothetical protein
MSWYNNQNQGFIDATQVLESGGGASSQTIISEIQDDITDINEVFIPYQLDANEGSLDTIIVNNTTGSRIFIKNANTTPLIRIQGGKLYLYYEYSFNNAPTITSGWIEVDSYITAIKQAVLGLEVAIIPVSTYVFGPLPTHLPAILLGIKTELVVNSGLITSINFRLGVVETYLARREGQDVAVDTSASLIGMVEEMDLARTRLGVSRSSYLDLLNSLPENLQGIALTNAIANLTRTSAQVADELAFFAVEVWNNVFIGFGIGGLILTAWLVDNQKEKQLMETEEKLILTYEKLMKLPSSTTLNTIHLNGLLIIQSTNFGFTAGTYNYTLSNGGKLEIKITNDTALIVKVSDIGLPTFTLNEMINIPKTSLGGTTGNLQIQITSLISAREEVKNRISQIAEEKEGIENRRRLRGGIINTDEIGDGLKTEYNSTITNTLTGEVLQVPTIKLNLNSTQLETISGVLNIKKYVNSDNLDLIHEVLLPAGATITSGYKLNLGYTEIFSGFAYDLIMLAVKEDTYLSYLTFDSTDYNYDYLGYFPNMSRLSLSGDYRVIFDSTIKINQDQHFTKGYIYITNVKFQNNNTNRKFEYVSFLRLHSMPSNLTEYYIFQTGTDTGLIDTTKLAVYIKSKKLVIKHPALVQYSTYASNPLGTLTTYIALNNYVNNSTSDDNVYIRAQPMVGTNEYKYKLNIINNPFYPFYNNGDNLVKITNDNYTLEQNGDTTYILMYLSHPNNGTLNLSASGIYPQIEYIIGQKNDGTFLENPPSNIKSITINFDIQFNNRTESGFDPTQPTTQVDYATTVSALDFKFQFSYSFNGTTFTKHIFTMADVDSQLTNTFTSYYHEWDYAQGTGGVFNKPKRYWSYTFNIPATYPDTGTQIKIVRFTLIRKTQAEYTWGQLYEYATTTSEKYNYQPFLYLFDFKLNEYSSTPINNQVISNNYATTETSTALTSLSSLNWYLFNLQLDLPNDSIGYYINNIYYNFTARSTIKLYASDVPMPDPGITFVNATFVSWANLTQDCTTLVIGNTPSSGALYFTHFNWRFFQTLDEVFLTFAQYQKLLGLIVYSYYDDYVSIDKYLYANELSANNIQTKRLVVGTNPLTQTFTPELRTRDLRDNQIQDEGNVLISLNNLYVENPTNNGNLIYNYSTRTVSVAQAGSGVGTREEEDEIILGLIEDSAGYGLIWNNTAKTLDVIPEIFYYDPTPIYTTITTKDQNMSNYVWDTSNYLKAQIDGILPYDPTPIYTTIATKDQNMSNYVWDTSNYLKAQIDGILPYDPTPIYTTIATKDQNMSNYVWDTSNYLKAQIDGILPYDPTPIYTTIATKDQNMSNYVWDTSNYLKSQIDGILPYDPTPIYTTITTKDQNMSNYVWDTSNYLKSQIDAILPYDPTPIYTQITSTSNILLDDFVSRDVILNTSIETNKYTDAKVETYLSSTIKKIIGGNVGIGTTNPLSLLEINGETPTLRIVGSSGAQNPRLELVRGTGDFGIDGATDWRFDNFNGLFRISRANGNSIPTFTIPLTIDYTGLITTLGNIKITTTAKLLFEAGTPSLPEPVVMGVGEGGTGAKIILYPSLTTYPYAIGVGASHMWSSIPGGATHQQYINGVQHLRLGSGAQILSSIGQANNYLIGLSTPATGFTKYNSSIVAEAVNSFQRHHLLFCVGNTADNTTNVALINVRQRIRYDSYTEFYGTGNSPTTTFTFFTAGSTSLLTGSTILAISVKINGSLWCTSVIAVSSSREIKKDIEELDDQECLNKLLKLKPCKYRYIDNKRNLHSTKKVFGFIAEEVKEVLPEAVDDTLTELIPNIYEMSSVEGYKLTISKELEINVEYTCYAEENDTPILITPLEDLGNGQYIINKNYETKTNILIYGKTINNFHALKKEYFHAIAISSIQEHHKIIMEQKNKINDLETRLAKLEAIVMGMLS